MPGTITDYIKHDLRERIRTGAATPGLSADLTLAALADHYRVSMTPVRRAVRDLIAERYLVKQSNGRLVVHRDAARRPTPPAAEAQPQAAPPDDVRPVQDRLTAEIIRTSLRGEASFLREESTAARLQTGRTVLREALNRLAGKGLVEHVPRRGWRVRPFDAADMEAYLEARVSMELTALRSARSRLVRDDLVRMLRGNAESRLDNELHHYLVEKSGNPYVRDFFDRHGVYFSALFDFAAPEAAVTSAMARQHRAILRALLAEDWRGAARALARHIRSQRPVLRRLLRRLGHVA